MVFIGSGGVAFEMTAAPWGPLAEVPAVAVGDHAEVAREPA
jgi:hypothetical protein